MEHHSSPEERPFASAPLSDDGTTHPQGEGSGRVEVLLVKRDESLADLRRRAETALTNLPKGESLAIVFPKKWNQQTAVRVRQEFFDLLTREKERVVLVLHDRIMQLTARDRSLRIITDKQELRSLLADNSERNRTVRHFASDEWQEHVYDTWRKLHVLSVHKVSVWIFLGMSVVLFFMVLFVALPSARIKVWPRESLISHTANIVLIQSGASLETASGVSLNRRHLLTLFPVQSTIHHTLEFREISKKFLGVNARVEMSLINESDEEYSFVKNTRLANQAGMIFRLTESVTIPAATALEPGVVRVMAEAASHDLYGEIIGERGNVPEGLKWEILGLPLEERTIVYARNAEAATGGITKYGTELQNKDLELAQKQLEQELVSMAKLQTEKDIEGMHARSGHEFVVLQYDVLTAMTFSGFVLPTDLIGQSVTTIPIEGGLSYTVLAYDKDAVHDLLMPGLLSHVDDGSELIPGTAVNDGISVHVIEYDDNLQWVKITAELTAKQRAVLAPVSKTGRSFGERVREAIQGKTVQEAERIIQNFPEVDHVEVSVWPPWRRALPSLSSNIVLQPQQ